MSTVQVVYVGKKEQEIDSIAGTGIVWTGVGDVQEVPVEAWEKMALHPDVWSLQEAEGSIEDEVDLGSSEVEPHEADQFDVMDDDALRIYAGKHLIKVHHKQTGDRLRAVVRAAAAKE